MRLLVGVLIAMMVIGASNHDLAGGDGRTGPPASGRAQELGKAMAADHGWTGRQWTCLRQLWQRESNWDPDAVNPSSGAYGIPQILPSAHGRPVPLGRAKPQIAWGLNYIQDRYGSPCEAWRFWQAHDPHWY